MKSGKEGQGLLGATLLVPKPPGRLHNLLHCAGFSCVGFLTVLLIFAVLRSFETHVPRLLLNCLAYAISDAALVLLTWLFLAAADGRAFASFGLNFEAGWQQRLLHGAGTGAAMMGVVALTMLVAHLAHYSRENSSPQGIIASFSGVAVFLLLAAALEEIAFRGYAFQRLIDALGAPTAIAVTSVLFGAGHLSNPSATALSTANTMLAGIVMALGYVRTRGLWFPIGLHFAWNLTLGPIAALPVSGLHVGGSPFLVRVSGPAWITGGDYGPEGGIILTVVCLAVIVWLARGVSWQDATGTSRSPQDAVEYQAR